MKYWFDDSFKVAERKVDGYAVEAVYAFVERGELFVRAALWKLNSRGGLDKRYKKPFRVVYNHGSLISDDFPELADLCMAGERITSGGFRNSFRDAAENIYHYACCAESNSANKRDVETVVAKYLLCDRKTAERFLSLCKGKNDDEKKEIAAAFVVEEEPKWAGKISDVIAKYHLETVDTVR